MTFPYIRKMQSRFTTKASVRRRGVPRIWQPRLHVLANTLV